MSTDPSKVNSQKSKVARSRAFPGQHEGEEVQLVFHQHPIVMRKALIFGLVAIIIGMMPLLLWSTTPLVTNQGFYNLAVKISLWVPAVVLLAWIYRWVGWYYSVYIVTNERLVEIKQKGFFNRRVSEFGLDKVQNVNYHISGLQAVIFQFGDITAQTYVGDLIMKTIHKPVQIHEQIVDVIRRYGQAQQ